MKFLRNFALQLILQLHHDSVSLTVAGKDRHVLQNLKSNSMSFFSAFSLTYKKMKKKKSLP